MPQIMTTGDAQALWEKEAKVAEAMRAFQRGMEQEPIPISLEAMAATLREAGWTVVPPDLPMPKPGQTWQAPIRHVNGRAVAIEPRSIKKIHQFIDRAYIHYDWRLGEDVCVSLVNWNRWARKTGARPI